VSISIDECSYPIVSCEFVDSEVYRVQTTDDAKPEPKPESTIWAVPDDVWEIIEEILSREYPRHRQDRKRVPLRPVLDGVVYKLRTGCQWNRIPKEYGDDSTIHRHFQAWCEMGIFDAIWRQLLLRCEGLGGIDWTWQSADGSMGKAMGKSTISADAVGPNPTDRGKKG